VRPRSISLLSLALLFGLISPLKAGNPPAASQTDPPVYKTHAREVVVDVVVSKGGNQPVSGLRAKDFVVMEDGKKQTVDYFEEHTAKTLPASALQPLPPMPPGVYTNVPPAPEGDAVNVLLLDSLNTDQQDQTYVHGQIMNFLKSMQPGTKVAIFTLSSQLRMVQGFTTDTSVLRDALSDPKYGVSPSRTSTSRTLSDKFDEKEDMARLSGMGPSASAMEAMAAMYASTAGYEADQRVAMTLEALKYMGRYLAGVPGRKNLIWFSSSFPITIFPNARDKQPDIRLQGYSAAIKQTADLLTVSKVAVYPIGAEGMMVDHGSDPVMHSDNGPVDVEGGEVSSQSGPGLQSLHGASKGCMECYVHENGSRSDKIAAMEQLAADTGGKAFYNTNDLNAAMQHAIADGSHYYTLVYSPTNKKMDGSYRRIDVKVPESKYNLAYRRGYNADDSLAVDSKPNTDPLHPLLLRGMPSSTQLLYGVRVIPVDPQPAANAPRAGKNAKLTGPTKRYSVDFMIRWTDVQLQTTAEGKHNGKLQVELLAYDHEGHALNWVGGTQAMDLTPDLYAAMQRSGVPAHFEIDLPVNTDVFLETGVYDWATGKAGTLEVPLNPDNVTAASRPPSQPKSH
jgi:VWFA-related protein